MADIIKKLQHLFNQNKQKSAERQMNESKNVPKKTRQSSDANNITLNEATLMEIMKQVEQTKEGMYTCDETFAMLDEYVELVTNQEEAQKLMPLVEAHLDACSGCKQKYKFLRAILESEIAENP
ncbi:MAG: zf-HC2 domain-containing protein [Chloroflexi bacterium]|nr:zf-HC2 domain-containing protein [Chloroflexota bacterium]